MKRTRKLDCLNVISAWQINTGCCSSFCNYDERGLIVMFYSKGIQAPKEYTLNFQKLLKDGNLFDFQWDMRHEERGVQMNSEWMSGVGRCGMYMWVGTNLSHGIHFIHEVIATFSHRGPAALFGFLGINKFKCPIILEKGTKAILTL